MLKNIEYDADKILNIGQKNVEYTAKNKKYGRTILKCRVGN